MFLIEDENHCILYTGDIRGKLWLLRNRSWESTAYRDVAETWWVEAIARHPVLIPYTTGFKRLSTIYLDTSFASRDVPYGDFPTKVLVHGHGM